MKRWLNKVLFLICVLIQIQCLIAQSKIKLIDESTAQPIHLAHIKFTNIATSEFKWTVTDEQGYALNPYNDSSTIEISYTGYEKKIITYSPSHHVTPTIQLKIADYGLNELVVTANFVPIELKESVYDIKTIDEEKISSKSAHNLREMLNTELNFRTNNGHSYETSINLNGLSGNHIKFMVDGVPVEGRLNENIDLSQINLNNIEKIEIIDGPTSVAYGTNALGGTINLITKKNQSKTVSVNLKNYYETVGQYNFGGDIGYKIKENLFKISLSRHFFDGFANPDTSRFKTWKPREQYFGAFQYSRRIKHLNLSYIVEGFTETMTSRGERRPPYYVTAFDTYNYTKRITNKILLNGRISTNHFIDFTLSQSYYNRIRNIYFKDLTTLKQFITDSDNDQDTTQFDNYMLRAVFVQKNDSIKFNFMTGVELKRDEIKAQRITNNQKTINDYAFFAGVNYKPIPSFTINPAVRYARNSQYPAPIVPSINFLFNLNENWQLKSSYAKGFRAPDLKELYMEFHYSSTINLYGNTLLLAENSDHINFSVNYNKHLKNHYFQLTPKVFYSKINNLIGLVQTSDVEWTYHNINFLTTKGTSFAFDYRYKKFTFNSGYNLYGRYNSMFDQNNFKNKYFYTSDINSSIGFFLDSLQLGFNINYKYSGLIENYFINDNKEIKESYIGDFHTFDASSTKYFFKEIVQLNVGIKNIFDVKDVLMVGDVYGVSNQSGANSLSVLWGRSYFVSLNFRF